MAQRGLILAAPTSGAGKTTVTLALLAALHRQGVSVAILNYSLCPSVWITEITPQIRRALIWLWRNAGDLGFDRDGLNVIGHSAGGHLTARMMATDWRAEADRLLAAMYTGVRPKLSRA